VGEPPQGHAGHAVAVVQHRAQQDRPGYPPAALVADPERGGRGETTARAAAGEDQACGVDA
jgi:hypothetical protein